ncbi:MAG: DUF2493 domain-containing protein [Planctomycetes bacterium]|nr:DUF2493 domain-containing protein [Planctomycetota bacterium]
MGKKIGIVGSRRRDKHKDYIKVREAFLEIYKKGDSIVSGGCPKGGDRFAEMIAKDEFIDIHIFKPDWSKGRFAGFTRNTDIARMSDVLIACVAPDRKGGTEDTIRKFTKRFHPKGKIILV